MIDWASLSEWITPDLGIGAVGGSIVTGAVALLIDQRRRLDEGKNRFSQEKLCAYEHILTCLDTVGQMLLLVAEFAPLFRKIESGEALDADDAKAQEALNERLESIMRKYDKHAREEAMLKLSLLSSDASVIAANRLMKVILKMGAHFDAGNYEKISKLALRYEYASAGYLVAAQRDLGVR